MTGPEFRKLRQSIGMAPREFMCELGYSDTGNTLQQRVRQYENGKRPIPLTLGRAAWMMVELLRVMPADSALEWPPECEA